MPPVVFPDQVEMGGSHQQRVAVAPPFLYLATGQYIGSFDIAEPAKPRFLGFRAFPEWPDISTLLVDQGVAYFTSGSTLIVANVSTQCPFEVITTMALPLPVFHVEVEGDRLYVDGKTGPDKSRIAIFSIADPFQIQELGIVEFGELGTWSVLADKIYWLGHDIEVVAVTEPANPSRQQIDLGLVLEDIDQSPALVRQDRLFSLLEFNTITIAGNWQALEPVVRQNPMKQIVMGDLRHFVFQVSDHYIFLGGYSCDVNCGSYVSIFSAEDASDVTRMGFPPPDAPIFSYHEVQPDIVYAFTIDSLLVIDMTNRSAPIVVAHVPFIR